MGLAVMYSILIIEDDPSFVAMMEVILQMEGYKVHTASDGRSGLVMIRENRPDLVLCDIMMPKMDGNSVLEALMAEPELATIPFIFVTALGDRADIRRGMSSGADDYLAKPFSADELLAAVAGRIRRHEILHHVSDEKSALTKERAIIRQKITRREQEVLLLVGQGITSREIAERLGVSLKTIEVHRANLLKKLGATNAASLARWAFIAGQIPDNECSSTR